MIPLSNALAATKMAANRYVVPVLLLSALVGAASPCAAQSKPNQAGTIRAFVPTDYVLRAGASPIEPHRNDPVYWQDTVRTERGGRVRIGLLDGSILNVGSESSLVVTQHDPSTQQTQLDLTYGRMRASAVRVVQPHGSFQVRTPVAVTGVVGTGFDVITTAIETLVICREDMVRVRNIEDRVLGIAILHAGEFTRVRSGMPPTAPAPATPEMLREGEEATSIPAGPLDWSRVEISWPPPNCGQGFALQVRAWSKQTQGEKQIETPVDPELVAGKLLLGGTTLSVEGGRATMAAAPGSNTPEGAFIPEGKQAPIPTKIWPPINFVPGEGWRAPRATFTGDAFYVLGPVGFARQVEFTFTGEPANVLWVGPCGAGFLAPTIAGGAYQVTLSLNGQPVARGEMNLVQVSYHVPTPPSVVRGQETKFGIELRGLAGLDRFVQGRPVDITILTNRTPAILGNLRSQTSGASGGGETIIYRVGAKNVDATGTARLDASGRGRQAGAFELGVENKLDDALGLPTTPLAPVRPGP